MREEQSPGGCGVLVGMTLTGLAGSQQQFPNAGSLISWESPAFTPQGQPSADLKRVRSAETKGLGQRARSGRAGSKFTLWPFGTLSLVPTGAAARVGRHGRLGPARRCRPHRKAPSPPQQRQKCHNPSSRHGQDVGTWAVFKLVPADAGWPRWCACPAEVPTSSPALCHTANIWKQGSSSRGWLAGPPHGLLSPVESPPPRHHCPLLQEQVLPDLPGASAAAPGGDPCSAAAMLGGGGDPRPSTPTSRSESSEPEWRPARLRHPVVTGDGATPQSQPHP